MGLADLITSSLQEKEEYLISQYEMVLEVKDLVTLDKIFEQIIALREKKGVNFDDFTKEYHRVRKKIKENIYAASEAEYFTEKADYTKIIFNIDGDFYYTIFEDELLDIYEVDPNDKSVRDTEVAEMKVRTSFCEFLLLDDPGKYFQKEVTYVEWDFGRFKHLRQENKVLLVKEAYIDRFYPPEHAKSLSRKKEIEFKGKVYPIN